MATEAARLTDAYRAAQARQAALIAALVAAYYRSKVSVENPASIERWLEIMIPRIMREQAASARLGAAFGNTLRKLEAPNAPAFTYEPIAGSKAEAIERSLRVVGPEAYLRKARDIQNAPEVDLPPTMRQALLKEADEIAVKRIAGAVARHVQSGSRRTVYEGQRQDPIALGYVRVTKADPCYFCAMLASRGLVFEESSFDASDARFTGGGDVKVHDSCACALKPVYDRKDEILDRTKTFEEQWSEWGVGGGSDAILNFRRGYEGRPHLIGKR